MVQLIAPALFLSVENPVRTAQYLATMESRRRDIRAFQAASLPAGSRFTWEVGCGHGHFLTAYAQAHPDEVCIGVDIVSDRIERAVKKRDRAKLKNLYFVHAEAKLFLELLPPSVTFSRLFVLFPDPWPKLRHHKHRIMQPEFLTDVAKRAGQGSRLYFRTDFTPYYADTKEVFMEHADWVIAADDEHPNPELWAFEHETVFQSRAAQYHSLIARLR